MKKAYTHSNYGFCFFHLYLLIFNFLLTFSHLLYNCFWNWIAKKFSYHNGFFVEGINVGGAGLEPATAWV